MDISLRPPCSAAEEGHEETESHIHCQQTCVSATQKSDHIMHPDPLHLLQFRGGSPKMMVVGLLTVHKVCKD